MTKRVGSVPQLYAILCVSGESFPFDISSRLFNTHLIVILSVIDNSHLKKQRLEVKIPSCSVFTLRHQLQRFISMDDSRVLT